jgi:NAD(P)H-hydrate epimerase
VVGGSVGKSGALCLAATGGLRAGAGLVTAALPVGLNLVAETKLTAAMSQPLPETAAGGLSLQGEHALNEMIFDRQAVVLGPGLGQEEESRELARRLAGSCARPLVIDADGLNALADKLEDVQWRSGQVVLTPHPGEAARLLNCTVQDIMADRPQAARRLAAMGRAVVVLKGARTLVATPRGELWVNPTGNVLLASGGSGDVLAGVIGGLMAQGMDALEAALAGVYVHGLAANLAAGEVGQRGLAAEELADYLAPAFKALEMPEEEDEEEEHHHH